MEMEKNNVKIGNQKICVYDFSAVFLQNVT